jgi:hypothetical protein
MDVASLILSIIESRLRVYVLKYMLHNAVERLKLLA